ALVVLLQGLAGQADEALDERPGLAANRLDSLRRRRVEDDHVTPRRVRDGEADPAREHAVARVAEASEPGLRAVEIRLHRGRRDPVRVDDPVLEPEDDEDRAGDRENPVEEDARVAREPREEPAERVVRAAACRDGWEVLRLIRRAVGVRVLRRWADGGPLRV